MRVILFCRLRTCRRSWPRAAAPFGNKGKSLMYKVMFAAALAVALVTAPMPQLVSSAAAQTNAPDKTAKMKKEPSAGQLAARERQKKCATEWKEAKATSKVEKGQTWPQFWSACNKRLKSASK